ncbi:MAG: hypothetical protein IJ529_04925 [Alphaproteobacteria bacterium]|nr:hypothetical protein [Alphaproteobacteria bacterium]
MKADDNKVTDVSRKAFELWLSACMHGPIGDHIHLMAYNGKPPSPAVDEQTQLRWLAENDWTAVRNYKHRWLGKAAVEFITKAPEDIVLWYIRYAAPLSTDEQIALVCRSISERREIFVYEYFNLYPAVPEAQKLIKENCSKQMWYRVLIVNYASEWKYEKKFGCIAAVQRKIKENFDALCACDFAQLEQVLDAIE